MHQKCKTHYNIQEKIQKYAQKDARNQNMHAICTKKFYIFRHFYFVRHFEMRRIGGGTFWNGTFWG